MQTSNELVPRGTYSKMYKTHPKKRQYKTKNRNSFN